MKYSHNILATDLSGESGQVMLTYNGVAHARQFACGRESGPLLKAAILDLMTSLQVDTKEIDIVAYSLGPGRFSGLRLSAGMLHAMAYAGRQSIVALSNLQNIAIQAQNVHKSKGKIGVIQMLPGENNGYYAAIYEHIEQEGWYIHQEPKHVSKLTDFDNLSLLVGDKDTTESKHSCDAYYQPSVNTLLAYADTVIQNKTVFQIELDYLKRGLFQPN